MLTLIKLLFYHHGEMMNMTTIPFHCGDGGPDDKELARILAEEAELDEYDDWEDEEDDEEDEGPQYAEIIADLTEAEARGQAWPGWSLDRSRPGLVVITTPSGRRYAFTPEGEPARLPADAVPGRQGPVKRR
jgi:hypothetical protein